MTRHFEVVNREVIGKERWDTFVDSADEAWLWHRFDAQDALSTWPGKHDLSFAILDGESGENIVAVVPLHLIESRIARLFSWNVLDSLGGPACSNNVGERLKRKIMECVSEQLMMLARQFDALRINLALSPMVPALCGNRFTVVNPLLVLGCQNIQTQIWAVDLRVGKDKVWKNLEGRARTAIRKAQKEEVVVRPATANPEDLDIYYRLHCETYLRTGVHPHPMPYFQAIWNNFLTKGYSYILFAVHNDKVVAAENFGVYKKAAVYWTGAASRDGLSLEANSLLQWSAMQWMLEKGIEWYETGEAFPHLKDGKLKGLNDFKKSFGGILYPCFRGQIDTMSRRHKIFKLVHQFGKALS